MQAVREGMLCRTWRRPTVREVMRGRRRLVMD